MGGAVQVFYCLLMMLGIVTAQESVTRALPNWLTAIIAVAVFLFLVFIAFIVNKAWCDDSGQEEKVNRTANDCAMSNGSNTNMNSVRSDEHHEAYENVTFHKSQETMTTF